MKRCRKLVILMILILAGMVGNHDLMSQNPPPSPGSHGQNGSPVGAPIDGGIGILLALGAAYGGRKIYMVWKKRDTE